MRRLLLTLACVWVACCTFAQQNDDLTSIAAYMRMAMRYNQLRPQEKVYLHLDNTSYFRGETIWFKGYVVRTDDGAPTDLSRILYVELLNPSGDVVAKRTLPISGEGTARGDIKVDSVMTTGFYEVRAYTRYMTNWGTNACFSRVLPIFEEPKNDGDWTEPKLDMFSYRHRLNKERAASDADGGAATVDMDEDAVAASDDDAEGERVRFFPEGGDVVRGLPTRVAFAITDKDGRPMTQTTCTLKAEDGSTLASTRTDANGFGLFALNGNEGDVRMQIEGKGKRFRLPQAKDEGCTMAVDMMRNDVVAIDLHASEAMRGRLLGLVVMHNGVLLKGDTLRAEASMRTEIDRKVFRQGVSQITVFDIEGRIQAERLVFVRPSQDEMDAARVKLTTPTQTLRPCSKVKFNIQAQPNATMSFAAVDAEGMLNGSVGNAQTWMLLSSELRGFIAHPEYYFESDDEAHRRAADLLMMVQGWRRYDWKLMTGQSTLLKNQPIEDKQYLFGRLRPKSKKNGVENVWLDTKMFNNQGQVVEGQTKTDSMGNYVFVLPNVEGEWRLSINTGKADKDGYWKDLDYVVAIDRNFSPLGKYVSPIEAESVPVDTTKLFRWNFTDEDEQWVSMTRKNHVLQNVTVKARRDWRDKGWRSNEEVGRSSAIIYYNCDEATDRYQDEGEEIPTFCEWLGEKNSLFTQTKEPLIDPLMIGEDSMGHLEVTVPPNGMNDDMVISPPSNTWVVFLDGMRYKGRPIIWVVDNTFNTITGLTSKSRLQDSPYLDVDCHSAMPEVGMMLDDVKAVYVSEDVEAMKRHINFTGIENIDAVVMFCYTHIMKTKQKTGLRSTHYQGFNVPSTFQMEDYATLPPMDDCRRTIFWQPDLKTDAQGRATVEFWNNSSCQRMHVSCEGMTTKGDFMTNE